MFRRSQLCLAAPQAAVGEIEGIIGLISQLAEAIAPKEKDIERFSEWYKLILKRCEYFHSGDFTIQEPGKLPFVKMLRGPEAIRRTFVETSQKILDNAAQVTLESLRPLRTFSWVLSSAEMTTLRSWVSIVLSRVARGNKAVTDDNVSASDGVAIINPLGGVYHVGGSSGSATSASSTKAVKKKNDSGLEQKAMVMKFFYKKGKT